MHKINTADYFKNFYYNFYDPKSRDQPLEVDGIQYKFVNQIDEKSGLMPSLTKMTTSNIAHIRTQSADSINPLKYTPSLQSPTKLNKLASISSNSQSNSPTKRGDRASSISVATPNTGTYMYKEDNQSEFNIKLNKAGSSPDNTEISSIPPNSNTHRKLVI